MSYFKKFPKFNYDTEQAVNILTAVLPSRMNIDNAYVYQNHRIGEGETAESIAEKIYSDANLYWTIFIVNNIINPFTDWPVQDDVFYEYVEKKYGSLTAINHYLDNRTNKMVDDLDDSKYRLMNVSSLPFYIIPVSNEQHERNLNDQKRDISVINPRYINQFVEIYHNTVQGK